MVHFYALAAAAAALATVATAAPAASSCTVGGYYDPVSASCKPCGGHAKTCKNPRIALTCNRGYYLSRGTCLVAASCPSGTFGSNSGSTAGTCAACYNSTFKTCTGTGSTAATSCVNNYCLGGGRCKPLSLIPNTQYCSKGQIVNCPKGVKTCSADGAALTCSTGYYFNATSPALPAAGGDASAGGDAAAPPGRRSTVVAGNCVTAANCPVGTAASNSTQSCETVKCGENVATCDAKGALTCNPNFFLNPYTKTCVADCPNTATYENDTLTPALFGDGKPLSSFDNPNVFSCYTDDEGAGHIDTCYQSYHFNNDCGTAQGCLDYASSIGYSGSPRMVYSIFG
ncbi:hypothetical protein JCM8097_009226 [Rhodosporidiobolus ruineniae]